MSIVTIKDTFIIEDIHNDFSLKKFIKKNTHLIILYKNLKNYYQIRQYDTDDNIYWYINKLDCKVLSDKIIKKQDFMWCHGMNEKIEYLNVMKQINEKINIIYDIGSNVGQISLQMYNFFKPHTIYCFEPDKENITFAKLKHKNNSVFKYINKGIYYGKKQDEVYGRGDNSCGGFYLGSCTKDKTFKDFYNNSIKYDNKIFELDELENFNIDKPDLIKIDVEGSEYNIITNSSIFKEVSYLIIEWHFPNIDFISFSKKNLPKHTIIYKEKAYLGGTYLLKLN